MLAYIRFETMRTLRNLRYLAFIVAMPVAFYLIWSRPGDVPPMVAMAVYAASGGALLGAGTAIAEDRLTGWTRQLRVTPLRDWQWLLGKVTQGVLMIVPGVLAVSLAAVLVGHVRLPAAHWIGLAGVLLLGALPLALLGLFVGLLLRGKTATVALVLTFVALMFLSGVITGGAALPDVIDQIGRLIPTYNLVRAGHQTAGGAPVGLGHLLNLAAWTVLATVGVLLRWRRASGLR